MLLALGPSPFKAHVLRTLAPQGDGPKPVIPAKAGLQFVDFAKALGPRFRGDERRENVCGVLVARMERSGMRGQQFRIQHGPGFRFVLSGLRAPSGLLAAAYGFRVHSPSASAPE